MRIETTRFGLLEMDEKVFIHFPWGMPGFEQLKRYVLLEHRDGPFQWLQSVDEPSVAFVVCSSEIMGIRYRVPEERKKPLELTQDEDFLILNMVSFDNDQKLVRFHLRGPLLFNVSSRTAYQWSIDTRELEKYLEKTERAEPDAVK